MLESLRIQGFRKYKDFSLDGFGQINFVLGDNNVGKTSLLEAIYAWACGKSVLPLTFTPLARGRYYGISSPYWVMEELLATVNNRKQLPLMMSFEACADGNLVSFTHKITPSDLLTEYDSSYKRIPDGIVPRSNGHLDTTVAGGSALNPVQPTIVARWEVEDAQGDKSTIDLTVPQIQVSEIRPFRSAKYIDVLSYISVVENVQMYSSLKREKLMREVVEAIGTSFPEISDFDVIPYPDGSQAPVSAVRVDGESLPLYAYGDGVQKWFYVLGAMSLYKNAIVCIDEVDSGLHPGAQVDFSVSMIRSALRNGVQLFLTTHNIEFMDHFLNGLSGMDDAPEDCVRIITLREIDGEVRARNLDAAEAREARESYNLELR
jgi:predicted ATPase